MEQFEIIDVKNENDVVKQWSKFIESHHYDYETDSFNFP